MLTYQTTENEIHVDLPKKSMLTYQTTKKPQQIILTNLRTSKKKNIELTNNTKQNVDSPKRGITN